MLQPPEQRPLIIVCDWLPPCFGAVGQYEYARAQEAAAAGRKTTLIGLGEQASTEQQTINAGDLTIVRIRARKANKASLLSRALWSLSQNVLLLRATAAAAKSDASEIKVTGSPPFLSYAVLLWRQFRRQHLVTYRITDFYPETAIAAKKGTALKAILPVVRALRKRADRIEALSLCQYNRLTESGIDPRKIDLVHDASPITTPSPSTPVAKPFAPGQTVLLYSGNLGVAHDWRAFAEGYRAHIQRGPNRIRLWLNATGVGAAALAQYCNEHRLPLHHSNPVPLDQLAGVLNAADAHLILLGDAFWGYVFPSKIYACVDTQRPCLFVGPEQSEIHHMLSADPRHASVRQHDIKGVETALARLCERASVNRQESLEIAEAIYPTV